LAKFFKMITENTPITFSDKLPQDVDVAIIGGGVIGIFTALFINRQGFKTIVLEKGRIAGEQSSRNWGWIRQQGRDEAEIPIMQHASRLWEEIDKELKGKCGFQRAGLMYIASSEEKLQQRQQWLSTAKSYGIDSLELDRQQLAKTLNQNQSQLYHQWLGAVCTPSDARAEPWQAVPEVAKLCHQEGVKIIENCAVRECQTSNGKLTALHTEKGLLKTSQAVLAGGAWSALFLKHHHIHIPQLSVRASVAQTTPLPELWQGNTADEKIGFRRRLDGGYSLALPDFIELFLGNNTLKNARTWLPVGKKYWNDLKFRMPVPSDYPDSSTAHQNWQADQQSPFEKMRVLNPTPPQKAIEMMQQRFGERFPIMKEVPILNSWAGMIDAMPDLVPIVDYVPQIKGLILATGMSGHGFGIAPAFGKIITELLQEKPPSYNINRFRFNRFNDGSKLILGPGI
jgi:glycine/D-amino acid oxidase-like deaminating enzyme